MARLKGPTKPYRRGVSGEGTCAFSRLHKRLKSAAQSVALAALVLTLAACSVRNRPPAAQGASQAASQPTVFSATDLMELSLVAVLELAPPADSPFPIGGLSGLVQGTREGTMWAISDDRGSVGPVRFYEFQIDRQALGKTQLAATAEYFLLGPDGAPIAPGTMDPESLGRRRSRARLAASTEPPSQSDLESPTAGWEVFVASEGDPALGIPAAILVFDDSLRQVGSLRVPSGYSPTPDGSQGIRKNLALESLTLTPDASQLISATENALYQDGPQSTPSAGSLARVIVFSLKTTEPTAEYLYPLGPTHAHPVPADGLAVNGLVELLALSDRRLLALERSYVEGVGNQVRIFLLELGPEKNVWQRQGSAANWPVLHKTLVADLEELGVPLDNYEGLMLGPKLADGRSTLLLVSDDNFSPATQHNYLAVLAF